VIVGCFWVATGPAIVNRLLPFDMAMLTVSCLSGAGYVLIPYPPNKFTGATDGVWAGFSNPASNELFVLDEGYVTDVLSWVAPNALKISWGYDFRDDVVAGMSSSKENRSTGLLLVGLEVAGWIDAVRATVLEVGCLAVVVAAGLVGLIGVVVVFAVVFEILLVFFTFK
jgi:hypothetical protein